MTDERLLRRPLGEGCKCVVWHQPAAYVPAEHHILPLSWGGRTVPSNLVTLCPNTHAAVHRLIDEHVRHGGDPGWEVTRHFGAYARDLALRAWLQRPDRPNITSLIAPHGSPHDTYASHSLRSPYAACVECGNDDPTEGFDLCSDCLEASDRW